MNKNVEQSKDRDEDHRNKYKIGQSVLVTIGGTFHIPPHDFHFGRSRTWCSFMARSSSRDEFRRPIGVLLFGFSALRCSERVDPGVRQRARPESGRSKKIFFWRHATGGDAEMTRTSTRDYTMLIGM